MRLRIMQQYEDICRKLNKKGIIDTISSKYTGGATMKYSPPSSNTQIMSVMRFGTPYDQAAMLATISKHIPRDRQRSFNLNKLLLRGAKDSEVYASLKAGEDFDRGGIFAKSYYKIISQNAELPDAPVYLDVGCGDGQITQAFSKLIGASKTVCLDVAKYNDDIDYTIVEDTPEYKLPFDDDSFDLITAFQVFHHVKNIEPMVNELKRVCKPGGLLFVKEHDCHTPGQHMVIDVEHLIYMVRDEGFNPDTDEYYINLYNMEKLDRLLDGFELQARDFYYTNNMRIQRPDRSFYTVYKKGERACG